MFCSTAKQWGINKSPQTILLGKMITFQYQCSYFVNNILNNSIQLQISNCMISQDTKKIPCLSTLNIALICQGVSAISKIYISVCRKLMLVLKLILALPSYAQFLPKISQCLEVLTILVQSTQFQKYGHIFPGFLVVIQRYEIIVKKKACFVKESKLFEQIQRNQKAPWLQRLVQIQITQIDFLQSNQANRFFTTSINNEAILHDSQCVCCSKGFVKDMMIQNRNPCIPILVQLTEQECKKNSQLLKKLCAICNGGGGVLIIGAKKIKGRLVACGTQFKTQDQLAYIQKQIITQACKIQPECFCKIERVPVYSSLKQQYHKSSSICVRILIYSLEQFKASYIQIQNKPFQSLFEFYQYNPQGIPTKVVYDLQKNSKRGAYQLMHEIYCKNGAHNCHQNIGCYLPHKYQSYQFNVYGQAEDQIFSKQNIVLEKQISKKADKNELKFKYKYTSLVVVGSSQSKRYIQMISDYLAQLKELFEFSKCFQECFQPTARSVWMLSHNRNYTDFKYIMEDFELKSEIKLGSIITMPVYKYLQIQRTKLSQYNQAQVLKKFIFQFEQEPEIHTFDTTDKKTAQKKKMVQFCFANYSQAIFAYIIFEQNHMRPYFVKNGSQQKSKKIY